MPVASGELVEAAVRSGLIDAESAARLRAVHRRRESLLEALTTGGRFPVAAVYRALAEARGLPFIDLATATIDPQAVRRIPEALLRKRSLLPVTSAAGEEYLATSEPDDRQTLSAVQRIVGRPLPLAVADPEALELTIDRLLGDREGTAAINPAASDAVALLDRILREAFLRRASDIHLEPFADGMRVRLRVDGRLQVYLSELDRTTSASLISRVKVLANLDIAEQRAPQDGRFSYEPPSSAIESMDVRVATAPTRWGERATMRLLGVEATQFSLESLGMSAGDLELFRQAISRPYGMVLLTGPTGSGKTTTLYAALREINETHRNIMTVEDPIEYLVPGVSQLHVGGTDKVTFASALRALLRHDPDVLMVGEIRDAETADVALKAAMTGHLIFSTLHTNTASGAVTRLVDIGCEPYLVGSTLAVVIAQRLVRRLCPRCKRTRPATSRELQLINVEREELELWEPVGCAHCLGSGFRGRIGLFEPLWIDRDLARVISRGASQAEIEEHAKDRLTTLRADGISKVLAGLTSLDEVLSATMLEI